MPEILPAQSADAVKMQFEDIEQQREADMLGMWVFLISETLLFAGLFLAFFVYWVTFPEAFSHAAKELELTLAVINTVVLLTSGLTMALAEIASQVDRRKLLITLLVITAILGTVFLILEGYEYYKGIEKGHVPLDGFEFRYSGPNPQNVEMFFNLYFMLTGLHFVHILIGVGIIIIMIVLAMRDHGPLQLDNKIRISGMYWAMVNILWILIFNLLYLAH